MGFTTDVLSRRALKADPHGALRYPQYDGVAFEFASSVDIAAAFNGRAPAHTYSRITNPTVENFEQTVAAVSGARAVVATASGMAAIASTVMSLAGAGTNIISSKYLFGNSYSLFDDTLADWGLETRFVDMADLDAIAAAIDDNTRAIFLETITNPQLQIADIPAICTLAEKAQLPVVLDGTLSTPYIFDAKAAGVAVEVLSSTKYISGGATAVGGLIIDYGTFAWKKCPKLAALAKKVGPFALAKKLRSEVQRNLGGCLSAHAANLQSIGLETLALRVERSSANALVIANYLQDRAEVRAVTYPGLPTHPQHQLARRLFGEHFGGLLTFDLGDRERCFAFMDALELVRRATNLNDNKTLVIHPASTIFCEFDDAQRAAMGVSDGLVRLSVGIEDVDDLLVDIKQALERIHI